MTAMLWVAVPILVLVAAAFMVLWILDARRSDDVASDPERVAQRRPRFRSGRGRAAHRSRPHPE
jgi:hypothetical protein